MDMKQFLALIGKAKRDRELVQSSLISEASKASLLAAIQDQLEKAQREFDAQVLALNRSLQDGIKEAPKGPQEPVQGSTSKGK